MADLTESIITHIKTHASFTAVHVGEVVPEEKTFPFVWIGRSGDSTEPTLCIGILPDTVFVDVEVVSDDIDEQRDLTIALKQHLRATAIHAVSFTDENATTAYVHAFDVDEHDDNYTLKSVDSDDRVFIGALKLTAFL